MLIQYSCTSSHVTVSKMNRNNCTILCYLILFLIICNAYIYDLPDINTAITSFRSNQLLIEQFVGTRPILAYAIYVAIYSLACLLLLPGTAFITLSAGLLFGTSVGFLLAILASTTGATITLVIYRNFLSTYFQRTKENILASASQYFLLDKPISLMFLRLIPLIPFNALNIAMTLTTISKRAFFIYTFIGMIPATYVVVNIGDKLEHIDSASDLLEGKFIFSLSLLGILLLAGLIIKNKISKKPSKS